MKAKAIYIVASLALATAAFAVPTRAQRKPTGDIRSVDFRNFTYTTTPCAGEGEPLTVKNGSYAVESEDDKVFFDVRDVVYGDLTGDGADEAVVLTNCNTGGTGQFSGGFVYTIRGSKPAVIGELGVGDRADGGIYRATVRDGVLYVDRFGQDGTSGACCPQYVETSALRWNGKELVESTKTTKRVYQDYLADDSPAPHAVRFLRGTSSATLVGATNDKESYRIGARAGQTLALDVDTKDAGAEVVVATKDGRRIGGTTGKGAITLKLPASGDYLISVRSDAPSDAADAYYRLDVSIL